MRLRQIKLFERQIINADIIKPILQRLHQQVRPNTKEFPSNEENIRKWIDSNVKNYLLKKYDGVVRVDQARDGLPLWVTKSAEEAGVDLDQWLQQNNLYELEIPEHYVEELVHVIDWLNTTRGPMMINQDNQLVKTPGGAQRLQNLNVPDAIRKANEMARASKKKETMQVDPDLDDTGPGIKTIAQFPNGFRWVQLLPASDQDYPELAKRIPQGLRIHNWTLDSRNPVLRRETYYMRHCIGTGSYDDLKNRQQYSLRDQKNEPHVTIEARGKNVEQIQGKANQAPAEKYIPYVAVFLTKGKFNVASNMYLNRMGLIRIGDTYLDRDAVAKIPGEELLKMGITTQQLRSLNLVRVGERVIRLEDAAKLPREELENSDLTDDELEKIGLFRTDEGLRSWEEMNTGTVIKRSVSLHNVLREIDLPENLTIEGNLTLTGWRSEKLPSGLTVHGDLTIADSKVKVIGSGLKVGKKITIRNSPVQHFPENVVCDAIEINSAEIIRITGLTVKQNATLQGESVKAISSSTFGGDFIARDSSLAEISEDVVFNGNVDLSGTPLTQIRFKSTGGSLILVKSQVKSLSDGLHVGRSTGLKDSRGMTAGSLHLEGTEITKLPRGLVVNEDLMLNTKIKEIPKDITAKCIWFDYGQIKEIPVGANIQKVSLSFGDDYEFMERASSIEEMKDAAASGIEYKWYPGVPFMVPEDWKE